MEALRRLWARVSRANERRARAIAALRSTEFWCDRHFELVERAGADPFLTTAHLSIALLHLEGAPPSGHWRHGCCKFPDDMVDKAIEGAVR